MCTDPSEVSKNGRSQLDPCRIESLVEKYCPQVPNDDLPIGLDHHPQNQGAVVCMKDLHTATEYPPTNRYMDIQIIVKYIQLW